MAAFTVEIGTGTTATYASFVIELTSITWSGLSRETINTSHLGTETNHTFVVADLYDPGEIVLEGHVKNTVAPPITAVASNLVVTWPPGDTTSWTVSAVLTDYEFSNPLEDKITFTATFKAMGAIAFDVTPA